MRVETHPIRWVLYAVGVFLAGLTWLVAMHSNPWPVTLLGFLPGFSLVITGGSAIAFGDDPRISIWMGFSSVVGMVMALLVLPWAGIAWSLVLLAASFASFICAGFLGASREPPIADIPKAKLNTRLAMDAAADEFMGAYVVNSSWPPPFMERPRRYSREIDQMLELAADKGWDKNSDSFYPQPPALAPEDVVIKSARLIRPFEYFDFESGYQPWDDEPGRERWLDYKDNRNAHVRILRHKDDKPRPWLIWVHALKLGGIPDLDFYFMRPEVLHERWGFNIAQPILPLHGKRNFLPINSGAGAVHGDMIDTVHLEAQAMWDLRRLMTWVRSQDPTKVGMMGYSLGGYTTALYGTLESELDAIICGNPATDLSLLFHRLIPTWVQRYVESCGLTDSKTHELLKLISPLERKQITPFEARGLFGGVVDRVTPPEQLHRLWEHWERPSIAWCQTGHLNYLRSRDSLDLTKSVFERNGFFTAS